MAQQDKINVELVTRKNRYGEDQVWAYCDRPLPGGNQDACDVGSIARSG
jgi:hypothetical protein